MVAKHSGLGRGIASLIPSGPSAARPASGSLAAEAAAAESGAAVAVLDRDAEVSSVPILRAVTAASDHDRHIEEGVLAGIEAEATERPSTFGSSGKPFQALTSNNHRPGGHSEDNNPFLNAAIARHPSAPAGTVIAMRDFKENNEDLPREPFKDLETKSKRRAVDIFFDDDTPEAAAAKQAWNAADAEGRIGFMKPSRPAAAVPEKELVPVPGARFQEIIIDMIEPNPWQPRTVFGEDELTELTSSIKEIGLLQPIVVRERRGGFELIMGERRWRAAQRAGLRKIPAIIRDTDDTAMLRDALLENLHRADLDPLEEATAYRQLLDDFGCTQEELASRIHRSRPQITNTLRLLKLPPSVQIRLSRGELTAGHARALLALEDAEAMERVAKRIVAEGLSVRSVEEIVALINETPVRQRNSVRSLRFPEMDQLAVRLTERFGAKVNVRLGQQTGKVTIEFDDLENLNRILTMIAPEEAGVLANLVPVQEELPVSVG